MPPSRVHLDDKRFRRFSTQIYCSGVEEAKCALLNGTRNELGQCYWHKRTAGGRHEPVGKTEVVHPVEDGGKAKSRMPSDRWDPLLSFPAESSGFRYFGREAAAHCLRHKRVLVAGDSTTRDTFYELMAAGGHTIIGGMSNDSLVYWGNNYEPRMPGSSGGRDLRGLCMGNHDRKIACLRDLSFEERHGPPTRFTFQFLTQSNSTWETGLVAGMLEDRAPDAAFIACPMYEWFKPDSYNYSMTKEERARIVLPKEIGPRHFEAIGRSCMQYLDMSIVRKYGLQTKIFLLGSTPLPGWARELGGEMVDRKVAHSIHHGLGIRCDDDGEGGYDLVSQFGITPIDRFALVGNRKRDAIHPFFNAQFGIVQLMLNHLCPAGQQLAS